MLQSQRRKPRFHIFPSNAGRKEREVSLWEVAHYRALNKAFRQGMREIVVLAKQ
jgi:hypothetical protein